MAVYTTVNVPPEVKRMLEERAGNRPIYRWLLDDVLKEPDTQKLVEMKLDAFQSKLDERLDKLEFKLDYRKESNKHTLLRRAGEIQGIYAALDKIDTSGDTRKFAVEESAGWQYDNREKFGLKPAEGVFIPPEKNES